MESSSQFLTNQQIEKQIEQAIALIHLKNKVRAQIVEELTEKKSDKYYLHGQLKEIQWKNGYVTQYIWDETSFNSEELDKPLSIKTLYYKTQHGSKTLADEKRIFREMRRAKETRLGIVCPKHTKINQNQVTFGEIQDMRREKRSFHLNVVKLNKKMESIKKEIKSLENSLHAINGKKGEIHAAILKLIKMQNYTC